VQLEPGRYQAKWFNPRTGEYLETPGAEAGLWTSPPAPDKEDWALLLTGT
jgi:hypothetical protein